MKEIVVLYNRQTAAESLFNNAVSFGCLLFCIWFSWRHGGGWWTFLTTGLFFLLIPTVRKEKLHSKQEAIEWAQSLPDDQPEQAK